MSMEADDLNKLVKLLLHPSSDALQQRHLCGIERLCREHQQGFFVGQLGQLQQVFDVTLQLVRQGGEQYVQPLCEVLRILSQPLLKKSAADDLRAAAALVPLLSSICAAFTWQLPAPLQTRAAEVITELATAHGNRPAVRAKSRSSGSRSSGLGGEGITPAQRLYEEYVRCLHSSATMGALVAALDTALAAPDAAAALTTTSTTRSSSPNQALVKALLGALLAASYSAELCEQVLAAGGAAPVGRLLQQCAAAGASSKQLPLVLELCWNLLELAPAAAAAALRPLPPSSAASGTSSHQLTAGDSSNAQVLMLSGAPSAAADGVPLADQGEVSAAAAAAAVEAGGSYGGEAEEGAAPDTAGAAGAAAGGAWVLEGLVVSLLQLAGELLATAECKQAKELRNDVLVVLHHLSRIPGATHLLAAAPDLLQPLLAAATTPELQQTHPCLSVVGLTLDDLDCEMKVVVWGILSAGAEATPTHPSVTRSGGSRVTPECPGTARSSSKQGRDGAAPATAGSSSREGTSRSSRGCGVDPCLQEAVGAGLLQVLLLYGEGGAGLTGVVGPGERRYSGEQQQLLQRHAWARLLQVVPAVGQDAFALAGGFTRCSRVLSSSTAPPAQVTTMLQLLTSLVKVDPGLALTVCQQGLLPLVLGQLQQQEEVCTAALQLLVRVCEVGGKEAVKAVREAGAIPTLLEQCQWWTSHAPALPALSALASLLSLWSCVLPAAPSRAELLAHDGMDVLLTALAQGNASLRPLVLSILADLLSDTRSHPFFHDWYLPAPTFGNTARNLASATVPTLPNALGTLASAIGVTPGSPAAAAAAAAGSGKLSAAGLLLGIWREQQLALGMADAKGVLNPSEEPWGCLLGAQGAVGGLEVAVAAGYGYLQPERRQLLDQLAAGYCPAQVLDKVYACITLLGPARLAPGLSPGDAASLRGVEVHLQLVQGAVWADMTRQLEEEGLEPTQEDRARLASGVRHAVLVATRVRQAQLDMLGAAAAAAAGQEAALYDALRSSAKAEVAARLYRRDDVRFTLREKLAAKVRKEEMLMRSMAQHSGLIGVGHADVPDRCSLPGGL